MIRGIILPVINRVGGKNTDKPAQVQAETDTNANINTGDSGTETQIEKDTNAAIRKPLKGASDLTKASQLTAGWHEDENGKWYQNVDGTYYAGGLQEIDGSTYYFGDNGYAQTGWVSVGLMIIILMMMEHMIQVSTRPELHLPLMMARESIQTSFLTVWKKTMLMQRSLCWDRMYQLGIHCTENGGYRSMSLETTAGIIRRQHFRYF